MSEYNTKIYLNEILNMIERIENSIPMGMTFEQFKKDYNLSDATAMRLQVIGECISNMPHLIQQKIKNWEEYSKMRNIISHKYAKVNFDILWKIVKTDLNNIKSNIYELNAV
jgi:uncharacterized protein with HEPN domain